MRIGLIAALVLAPVLAFAGSKNYDVAIDGMTCDHCVKSVTEALSKLKNVDPATVKVVLNEKKATLTVKEDDKTTVDAIKKAVESAGFKVTTINTPEAAAAKKN